MADSKIYQSKDNGALWILPDGPNTKPQYLPCHDLEDVTENNGSITLIQCIDARGEYIAIGATQDAPEPTTTTLGTYIGPVADFMETVRCPFALYVHLRSCGRADSFENYDRTAIIQVQKVVTRTRSGLVRKDEDVPAMHTFDVEALPEVIDIFRLTMVNESIQTTHAITTIRFLDDPSCWPKCGESRTSCSYGYAGTDPSAVSPAAAGQVLLKTPTVGTWTPTAADPFGAGEAVGDIAVFKVGQNVTRILTVRGTTDAGNPMEVAYSDDSGATWTNVNVGSTNGEYAIGRGALFAFNQFDIWLVSSDGYIYKSEDGGATWSIQEAGTITVAPYNAVEFTDVRNGYAVGDNGIMVRTKNGGVTWGTVTDPSGGGTDLRSLDLITDDFVWVGAEDGGLHYTNDGGDNWSDRTFGGTTDPILDITFYSPYFGGLVQDAANSIFFTINGGFSWELQDQVTGVTGGVALHICSPTLAYFAGTLTGPVPTIAVLSI